jgi:hypothetical protein
MVETRRVITYDEVVAAGTQRFVETGTIDLQALADDVAVSRATLYRVIPGRDRVLGDVVWWFGAQHHRDACEAVGGDGAERVVGVLRTFGETILTQRSFLRFLEEEPDVAARVLFTPSGGVHERFVAVNAELLRSAAGSGELPFDLDTTAYVISRVYESMLYADLLSGRQPDLDVADRVTAAVLAAA